MPHLLTIKRATKTAIRTSRDSPEVFDERLPVLRHLGRAWIDGS